MQWEQEDAAAEVHRRLLMHVPDDLDAITFLFHYHRKRDEVEARDYALQARRLKPASEEMLQMVVAGHFLAGRRLALQGRTDEARAELAAAGAVNSVADGFDYDLTVRRAMVEFKAGQAEAGRRLVEQALSESDDPADVYLALSIEAVRYDLPFQLDDLPKQFSDRWQSSLKKRRSRAAGAMSRRMWAFMGETGKFSEKLAFLNDYLERRHQVRQRRDADSLAGRRPVECLPFPRSSRRGSPVPGSPQETSEVSRCRPHEVFPGARLPRDARGNGNAAGAHFLQSPPGPPVFRDGDRNREDVLK